MWSLTNMTSGESLIRQLVYGKRLQGSVRRGQPPAVAAGHLWLFGRAAADPQRLRRGRLVTEDLLVLQRATASLSLLHLAGRGRLAGDLLPARFLPPHRPARDLRRMEEPRAKARPGAFLLPYGYGDGGGGPAGR